MSDSIITFKAVNVYSAHIDMWSDPMEDVIRFQIYATHGITLVNVLHAIKVTL